MASNVWHSLMSLRFSGFMETGVWWFVQVREAMKVLMEYNPLRRSSPHISHKIKMASIHMSMDEVAKTYKITPVRRF